MTAPALADAISKVRESVAVSRKAVNKWIVDDRRVPKADLVGHLILLAGETDRLLAALREPAPAPDYDWCPNCKQDDCVCCAPAPSAKETSNA